MKKIFCFILITSLVGISCQKRILDQNPRSFFVDEDIWSDFGLVQQFENDIYNGLGGFNMPGQGDVLLDQFTDDARTSESIGNNWSINQGNITSSSMGAFSGIWELNYNNIRKANIFLSKVDNIDVGDAQTKSVLKGEVKYLRAAMYFSLINYFGGVPLVTEVFDLTGDFTLPRSNYEDMVDWIVKELDEATTLVPQNRPSSEWGRITKGICLATKARVLLYANSPVHKPGTLGPNGPLFDYTKDTWQDCSDAAKAVIDIPQYELQQFSTPEEYANLFLVPNKGIIFPRVNSVDHPYSGSKFSRLLSPDPAGGINEFTPLQGMINQFQMANGKFISDPSSGFNPAPNNIYLNREIRFYTDISYYGTTYKGVDFGFAFPDGAFVTSQRQSTGYVMRKYLDENVKMNDPDAFWARYRLAEMYLIYAEAQMHLGDEPEALKYINLIRERVQLPGLVDLKGKELMNALIHERRIELCFEGHRFFDTRRWMIIDSTGNAPAIGIILEKKNSSGNLDPNGTLTYRFQTIADRKFDKKFYYLPIPLSEIQRSGINQNPGY